MLGGPLAIAAQANLDVFWVASGEPVQRGEGAAAAPDSPAAFLGDFAETRSFGVASTVETGFSYKTGLLSSREFALMGRERNGVFLT